jgi:hypothetical protein
MAARCGFLGARGPHRLLSVHQWPASGREGFSAAVDRVDRASGHSGRRCLATRARKLSLVHARCRRGGSEAAQVGGGARQLEKVRNNDTGRPDPRPTPLATYRRCLGPVASHRDLPRRQPCEWSPRGRSWSPCMGVAQIRASSHFGPPPVRPHPRHPFVSPFQPCPPGTQKAPCGHSHPLGVQVVDRKVAQIWTLSAQETQTGLRQAKTSPKNAKRERIDKVEKGLAGAD